MAKTDKKDEPQKPVVPDAVAAAGDPTGTADEATGKAADTEKAGSTPPTKPKDDTKPKTKRVAGVRIVSKTDSFRRAGFTFSKQPTDIQLSTLSKEQIKALSNETMLQAETIEIEVEASQE